MQLPRKQFIQCVPITVLFLAAFVSPAAASTLTFDDLPSPASETLEVPDGYGDIQWSSGNWQYYAEAQPPYTAHSGSNRAFSYSFDNTFSFISGPVFFEGAWFAGGSGTNDTVQFQLYRAGALVHTSASLYLTSTPVFLAAGYGGLVDAVSISEDPVMRPNDTDFVMDDVQFRSELSAPEPGSYSLVLTGIIIAAAIQFYRNRLRTLRSA